MIDLEQANRDLAGMTAEERIRWAYDQFGDSIVSTTSGGETSALTPHLIATALGSQLRPKIIFCDTGYCTPETLDMVQWIARDSDVVTYYPKMTPKEIEDAYPGWNRDAASDAFEIVGVMCKQEPLNRAFDDLKPELWIRGIMAWETPERANADLLEYREGMYRLHPILDWSYEKAESFMAEQGLPRNLKHFDVFKGEDQSLECSIDGAGRVVFSEAH